MSKAQQFLDTVAEDISGHPAKLKEYLQHAIKGSQDFTMHLNHCHSALKEHDPHHDELKTLEGMVHHEAEQQKKLHDIMHTLETAK